MIFPLYLSESDKNLLIKDLEFFLNDEFKKERNMTKRNSIMSVLEKLKVSKGKNDDYQHLVELSLNQSQFNGNRYVVIKVSKRTYRIIRTEFEKYNPSHGMYGGSGFPDQEMFMLYADFITKNLDYGKMCKIYTLLALELEIPQHLQKYMVEEDQENE